MHIREPRLISGSDSSNSQGLDMPTQNEVCARAVTLLERLVTPTPGMSDTAETARLRDEARSFLANLGAGESLIPALEVHRVLWCSTAHLTKDIAKRMWSVGVHEDLPLFYPLECGWLMRVSGYLSEGEDDEATAPELKPLLDLCRARGISWVRFDCDAPKINGLPHWDW